MNTDFKLIEVQQILKYKDEINNNNKINELMKKYKNELENFKYIDNENYFKNKKKIYVRYVSFDNKINYGGFFVKSEKKNNTTYIYLINTKKKIWYIDFNKNYIFINKIITEDDKIRKSFIEFLEKNK
jgi:hypothetical protein